MEVSKPEYNPKIMCNRISQLVERGTAFRRAALWTINTIMNAGALGAEVTISGKLRSERAHFEKHSAGMIPKSGEMADRIVKEGVTHVLTKMGMMGIRLKIALGNEVPQEFEYIEGTASIPESDQQEQTQVPDAIEVEAEKPSVNQGIKG
jgi:small subunit ribosomal protein S3